MSKDIWHKLPEQPENGRDVIEKWHHLGIHYTHFVAKNGIAEDNPFTDAWCYLDDLLALETGNKDLSDKIGKLEAELDRTRKALDVAVDALKNIGASYPRITDIAMQDKANKALNEITALEQKDVK